MGWLHMALSGARLPDTLICQSAPKLNQRCRSFHGPRDPAVQGLAAGDRPHDLAADSGPGQFDPAGIAWCLSGGDRLGGHPPVALHAPGKPVRLTETGGSVSGFPALRAEAVAARERGPALGAGDPETGHGFSPRREVDEVPVHRCGERELPRQKLVPGSCCQPKWQLCLAIPSGQSTPARGSGAAGPHPLGLCPLKRVLLHAAR
jgi:hypothetical protein